MMGREEALKEELAAAKLAIKAALLWLPAPGEDATGRFERVGDAYYRAHGVLRPGKSEPIETGRDANSEENRERFNAWCDAEVRKAVDSLHAVLEEP